MKATFVLRVVLVCVSVATCAWLAQPPPKVNPKVTLELLPNPLVVKLLGRSQLEFVADLFWVRMANMAGNAATPEECAALLPIANLIADLAPRFKYPYFVGGVMAPYRHYATGGRSTYENVEGAHALMTRGLQAVPDYTRLAIQKAYTELEMMHDPAAAGRTLREAATLPGSPWFLPGLATRLLTSAGEFDDARQFAQSMAQSDDPQLRADFELRVKQIDLERVLVAVEAAAGSFAQKEGRPPATVEELVRGGFLEGMPVDPFGGVIELTETGARSSVESRRLKVHVPLE